MSALMTRVPNRRLVFGMQVAWVQTLLLGIPESFNLGRLGKLAQGNFRGVYSLRLARPS